MPRTSPSPRPFPRPRLAALLLVGAAAGAFVPAAQAAYQAPAVLTSALACNAIDAATTRPTRSFGAHNYGAKAISVTCPLSLPARPAAVYGVMAYGGSAAFGERVYCFLLSLREKDGHIYAVKTFTVGGHQQGMPGTWVYLEPAERQWDAVLEVNCALPANNRAWLTAFEAYAG